MMLENMYTLLDSVGVIWYTIIVFALAILSVHTLLYISWIVIPDIVKKIKKIRKRNLQLNNTLLYAYNNYRKFGGKKDILQFKDMINRINWKCIEVYDETSHDYPSQVIECKNKNISEEMIKNG